MCLGHCCGEEADPSASLGMTIFAGGNARSLDFASGSLRESDAALGMTNFIGDGVRKLRRVNRYELGCGGWGIIGFGGGWGFVGVGCSVEIKAGMARFTGKRRGEMAEAAFVAKAVSLGFGVAKPWGDSDPFDFIVQAGGKLSKVQVKSAHCDGRRRHLQHSGARA